MKNTNSKSFLSTLLTLIITAVLVGTSVYWMQGKKQISESKNSENKKSEATLSIDQEISGTSVITVKDTFNKEAKFSMNFPSSWGFVNVKKTNLTDCGFNCNPPQRAIYKFTSEFNNDLYLSVIISHAKEKNNPLVTQKNRIFIAEDDTYFYNYKPSTEFCTKEIACNNDELQKINNEILEITNSFNIK